MSLAVLAAPEKRGLRVLLDHFAVIEDPREPWRVAHPLPEVLLLVVCGTIVGCDDYEGIAAWGEAHLPVPPWRAGRPLADRMERRLSRPILGHLPR